MFDIVTLKDAEGNPIRNGKGGFKKIAVCNAEGCGKRGAEARIHRLPLTFFTLTYHFCFGGDKSSPFLPSLNSS